MHHCRFLLVWTVRCTFSFRMVFFYPVTAGWIWTSSAYVKSQSTNKYFDLRQARSSFVILVIVVAVSHIQRIDYRPEKTNLHGVASPACGLLNSEKSTKI